MISRLRRLAPVLLLPLSGFASAEDEAGKALDQCNVIWTSPSKNAGESMPVGGGDTGCNVWVENGDLFVYFQRSGSFSENGEYLKQGRLRLQLSPSPLQAPASFRQELELRDGFIEIEAKGADATSFIVKLRVWVEVAQPVIHLDVESERAIDVTASYENWRLEDRELKDGNYGQRFGGFSLEGYPGKVFKLKDQVAFEEDGVVFLHRNPAQCQIPGLLIEQQGLQAQASEIPDHTGNRTSGGCLWGTNFIPAGNRDGEYLGTPFRAWMLKSREPARTHHLQVATHIAQTRQLEDWKTGLKAIVDSARQPIEPRFKNTTDWWHAFWDRSWIHVQPDNNDPKSKAWQAGRNYNLFRYQLGCNVTGDYPTKFNGGNFTVDPILINGKTGVDPDWRAWGGDVFTGQNQRLVYWPMLKSGDFEAMLPQFRLYEKGLRGATVRARTYFGHAGAMYSEYTSAWGLDLGAGWGWKGSSVRGRGAEVPFGDPSVNGMGNPVEHGIMASGSISYHWESQVENAYMILEYQRFTGADIKPFLPFIDAALVFFDEHYQLRQKMRNGKTLDENGKLVIYPSTSCESYRGAKNPADLVSGIAACLDSLVALPEGILPEGRKAYYEGYRSRLPGLNYGEVKGERILKPAESWVRYQNVECPQFYPLFPFNRFDLESPEIPVFRSTWKHGTFAKNNVISWHQDGIFFARMGMTAEAADFNVRKLQDAPRRFPTFWGPGHDWTPDHNWGGSGMIGLQEMLLQTVGQKIHILPAWPKEWDVDFKLHAPGKTVVECSYRKGAIAKLTVTPESRRKDVILPQ